MTSQPTYTIAPKVTRYYLDTEFIERGHQHPIELISIGMVSDDGREFYAVASDGFDVHHASYQQLADVLPQLPPADSREWMTREQISLALLEFTAGTKPEFWGYYAEYDWVVLCQLYGAMIDLPKTWPKHCNDIKQLADNGGFSKLPKLEGVIAHNALHGAREIRFRHSWMTSISAQILKAIAGDDKEEGKL